MSASIFERPTKTPVELQPMLSVITTDAIEQGIEEISSIARLPSGGRECYAFTPAEDQAFDVIYQRGEQLQELAREKGLEVTMQTDAIGNLYLRLNGKQPELSAIGMGSHIDSVKLGGSYDGVAGVEAGYRTIEAMVQAGHQPERSVELIAFRAEESSPRTGFACLGSAVATGKVTSERLQQVPDKLREQTSIVNVLEARGQSLSDIENLINNPTITPEAYAAFIELHIEQSAVLDTQGLGVAVVIDAIGGNKRYDFQFKPTEESVEEEVEYSISEQVQFTV